MKLNFLPKKRYAASLMVGLFAFVSLLSLFPQPVSAAGETYTWQNIDTIIMKGNDLKGGSITLKRQTFGTNQFKGGGKYLKGNNGQDCGILFTITTSGNNTGTLNAAKSDELTDEGTIPGCPPNILNQYNGKTVNIAGNPGEETPDGKGVSILVLIPKAEGDAPAKIKLSITDAAGKELTSVNADRETLSSDNKTWSYFATFSVGANADYKACAGPPINKCEAFHKNPGEKKNITFGEGADTKNIDVKIIVKGARSAGEAFTFGPVDVTMKPVAGGATTTIQTDSQEVPAVEEGAGAIGDFTGTLTGTFDPVEAGEWEICVPAINQCKKVTKKSFVALEVTFNSDDLDAFQGATGEGAKPTCDLGFWALNTFACPLSEAAITAIEKFNALITEKLTFDVRAMFDTDKEPGSNYYAIWNIFRTIALSIIVIVGTIMIASEAIGVGIFSAYTIRAVLPRLLISALFIVLSWQVAEFIVLFINNVGTWVGDLIIQPFKDTGFFEGENNPTLLGSLAQGAALIAALVFLGPLGALMAIGLIFVIYGVAYLVLTIWSWMLIFFIIVAPVFIALGALKGIDQAWQWFWKNFSQLLLVALAAPPIIALGKVGGAVAKSASGDAGGLSQVIGALVALLVIMALFFNRSGVFGAAVNKVGGAGRNFANRRRAGLMKRGSERMAAKREKYAEKAKTGTLMPGWTGSFGHRVGEITRGAYAARKAGVNPLYARKQWEQARSQDAVTRSNAVLQSKEWKPISQDDDVARAATAESEGAAIQMLKNRYVASGQSEAAADTLAKTKVASLRAAGFHIGDHGLRMAGYKQMAANGSAFDSLEDAMGTMTNVAANASERAELSGALKQGAGARPDTGGMSFGTLFNLANRAAAGNATETDFRNAKVEAVRNNAAHQLLNAKETAVKQLGTALTQDLSIHAGAVREPRPGMSANELAEHRRKANENVALQNRLAQSGTYAGLANVAAMYDITNRVEINERGEPIHPDASNRGVVQRNIQLGTPGTTQQVYVREGPAPGDGGAPAGGPVPAGGGTGERFVMRPEFVPNPQYQAGQPAQPPTPAQPAGVPAVPASPLNEEARRFQALQGMPGPNVQEHEIRTGGGGA